MADTPYPLRRRRRSTGAPRMLTRRRIRLLLVALLGLAVVAGVTVLAMRRDPPDARRSLADAIATLNAGNYSAARNNAQKAIAAVPDSGTQAQANSLLAPAHTVLARAYLGLGDGLAAEAELGRARDAGIPADRLYQFQAEARLLQGDADGAIEAADQAPARYAGYARHIRAAAMAAQGDTAGARAILQGLVDRRPRDGRVWTTLGRVALVSGDIGTAADAAARAVSILPGEPAALTLQGEVIRKRYGLVAALPWFEKALASDAYYHPALIEYAATLGDAGRYADMLSATRRAQKARPGSPQALYLQAVLAARAGRVELARSLLGKTGGAIDGVPAAVLLSGALDYVEGKFEQASATWRGLVRAQPMNVAVRRLLGAALLRSGDPQGALDVLRPIGLRGDADSYSLDLIARAFAATGEGASAADYLDRADRGATRPSAIFAIDDQPGALEAAAAVAADDPNLALAVIRGRAQAGNIVGATAKARALVAASPGSPAAQRALGDMLALAGRDAEAAPVYARAANLAFDEPTMLRLIDALGRTGRTSDAAATLALYLSQNPQSTTGQRLLGHWQVAAGDWNAAINTLEGVRRRSGNRDALLLTDLALAYTGAYTGAYMGKYVGPGNGADHGEDEVALRYGRAAYALAPMNAAAADAYGVALAGVGNLDGARQMLVKAVTLAPGNRAIAGHLAQLR